MDLISELERLTAIDLCIRQSPVRQEPIGSSETAAPCDEMKLKHLAYIKVSLAPGDEANPQWQTIVAKVLVVSKQGSDFCRVVKCAEFHEASSEAEAKRAQAQWIRQLEASGVKTLRFLSEAAIDNFIQGGKKAMSAYGLKMRSPTSHGRSRPAKQLASPGTQSVALNLPVFSERP